MASSAVVLVHGGLYEDVDSGTFWGRTGIGAGLQAAGYRVYAPARPPTPRSWEEERDALVGAITSRTSGPVALVAASNGCSVALRAAIDVPDLIEALVLCWPATAGNEEIDADVRQRIMAVVGGATADRLLAGQTIRGVLDEELETIGVLVTVVPSPDGDPFHRSETVASLRRLIPNVRIAEATPPAPREDFRHYRSRFIAGLAGVLG